MKNYTLLFLFLIIALPLAAQRNRKAPAPDPLEVATEAMRVYDFQQAIDVLEKKIATEEKKRRGRQSTVQEEALLEIARHNLLKLQATEMVTFIDSIVISKDDMLNALQISEECGRMESYTSHFNVSDNSDCAVFINQLGNNEIFSKADKDQHLRLFQRERIGEQWKAPKMLEELVNDESEDYNYPFLLGDGLTLYFGAQREDGLGGYDIYMTRFDSDEHAYLSPENVGMPFNSPSNDYLLAIDDYYQLGYLVTDRNQPEGMVCLYTFIPNETRQIYEEETTPYSIICDRARITCIADTWVDEQKVSQARKRLAQLQESRQVKEEKHEFTFIVDDTRTFHHTEQFSQPAQDLVKQWNMNITAYREKQQQLEELRTKYAYAVKESKQALAPQIHSLEQQCEQHYTQSKMLEKEIRRIMIEK